MDEINKAYNEYYEYTNDFIRSAYNITQQDKKEIQQLNKEKKELNKEIDELNKDIDDINDENEKLKKEIYDLHP